MTLFSPVPVSLTRALAAVQRLCLTRPLLAWPQLNERSTRFSAYSRPNCSAVAIADLSSHTDWPSLEEAEAEYSKKKPPVHSSIPTLTNDFDFEADLEKDCLILSGVKETGNDQKDLKTATNILKHLKISSSPVKTFCMGSTR